MALINWSENYSVSVKEIDSQHKKLVDLINSLHEGMKAGRGKDVLGTVLNDLVNYTAYHFSFEEKLFEKYSYPELNTHKRQHADLVVQVLAYKESFETGKSVLTIEIMNFLSDWLTKHIAGSDKKYTSFLNSKGVS